MGERNSLAHIRSISRSIYMVRELLFGRGVDDAVHSKCGLSQDPIERIECVLEFERLPFVRFSQTSTGSIWWAFNNIFHKFIEKNRIGCIAKISRYVTHYWLVGWLVVGSSNGLNQYYYIILRWDWKYVELRRKVFVESLCSKWEDAIVWCNQSNKAKPETTHTYTRTHFACQS